LLLVPAAAIGVGSLADAQPHLRDDIRREVREGYAARSRARFAARRDVYRAWARQRNDVRQAVRGRGATHGASTAGRREFRRTWWD